MRLAPCALRVALLRFALYIPVTKAYDLAMKAAEQTMESEEEKVEVHASQLTCGPARQPVLLLHMSFSSSPLSSGEGREKHGKA